MKLYHVRYTTPDGRRGYLLPSDPLPSAKAAMEEARRELPKGYVVTSAYEAASSKRKGK